MKPQKYIAVKVKHLGHWLWFETAKTNETEDGRFVGTGGWGEGGAYTEIDCPLEMIEARICCDSPQYD